MAYIIRKPMDIAGKRRSIGEVLNDEEVNQSRVYSLVKSGYLSEVRTMPELVHIPMGMPEGTSSIIIPIKQGEFEVEITAEDVVHVFGILQETVDIAAERIKSIEKEEILILIDATDSRKGVKVAAAEQARKINQKIEYNEENNSSVESDDHENLSETETLSETGSAEFEKQEGEE